MAGDYQLSIRFILAQKNIKKAKNKKTKTFYRAKEKIILEEN